MIEDSLSIFTSCYQIRSLAIRAGKVMNAFHGPDRARTKSESTLHLATRVCGCLCDV